jgi:cytochrome P450
LLEYAPFSYLRKARISFLEWGKYMNEIYDRKFNEILQSKGPEDEGMDLMGAMIRGSGQIPGTVNHGKHDAGMTQEEIIGNSFVLFLAGHETAANSIHFSLLYLAMRPDAQRKLQADLDAIFGDRRDPSRWDYDSDLPKLFAGWAGAVMNEQLRLIPPVNTIPKSTAPGSPQPLIIDGKEYIVPENCSIGLHAVGVHRNPKYWPHGPVRKLGAVNANSNPDNDLEEFKPERWLANDKTAAAATDAGNAPLSVPSTDGLAVDTTPDTTSAFKPPKGAYIPFSDGPRACLGRRFAQVEILATLAVIFSRYSVELAVDEWASVEEVGRMDGEQRAQVWSKARAEVERKMRDEMATIITLQLRGEGVRLRLVERGREWFGAGDGEDAGNR